VKAVNPRIAVGSTYLSCCPEMISTYLTFFVAKRASSLNCELQECDHAQCNDLYARFKDRTQDHDSMQGHSCIDADACHMFKTFLMLWTTTEGYLEPCQGVTLEGGPHINRFHEAYELCAAFVECFRENSRRTHSGHLDCV